MNKKLVAYFSASGVTKKVAQKIADTINGDLFEIVPTEPYTNEDLNWNDSNSRSSREMADKNSRPLVANHIDNIEEYNIIYLGYPIWWGVAPTIINTFLETYNLVGKKIITFATSGGSGMGNSTEVLKASAPNSEFVNGKVLRLDEVESFIKNISE